jgi:uncharacterized membrane protein YjjP (DUF1212 family)
MVAANEIKDMTKEEVLEIALTAGKLLLCNGAETYRVEDTMLRICALRNMTTVSAFCTPSVILLSDESLLGFSRMYRVTNRTVDLTVISEINDFSFNLKNMRKTYAEIMAFFNARLNKPVRPAYVDVLCSGVAGACFAVVLGGGFNEFAAALLGSLLSMAFLKKLATFKPSSFWSTTMAGGIICAVTLFFRHLVPSTSMELTIAGAIMPYLPGMAFTNGLRDYIAGDLISGSSRVGEAVFLVGGLVIGIATVLGIFYH